MNKTRIIFISSLIFIIVFFCIYVYYCLCLCCPCVSENDNLQNKINSETEKKGADISRVCFNEKCFDVEIANTPEMRAQGLMNKEYLDQNNGMLFLFRAEAKYSFWMKNTLIPLDIIWLDKNRKVVFIKHNAMPCKANPCDTFKPNKKAKYVFEINSGLAKELDLKEGDYLEFK